MRVDITLSFRATHANQLRIEPRLIVLRPLDTLRQTIQRRGAITGGFRSSQLKLANLEPSSNKFTEHIIKLPIGLFNYGRTSSLSVERLTAMQDVESSTPRAAPGLRTTSGPDQYSRP